MFRGVIISRWIHQWGRSRQRGVHSGCLFYNGWKVTQESISKPKKYSEAHLQRVRKNLRHVLQPKQAQADAQEPREQDGQEVPHMRQSLRIYACDGHAPSDPRPQTQVRRVRQSIQPALAAARPHALTHRREAFWVRALWQSIRRPVKPACSHADALSLQALQVQTV